MLDYFGECLRAHIPQFKPRLNHLIIAGLLWLCEKPHLADRNGELVDECFDLCSTFETCGVLLGSVAAVIGGSPILARRFDFPVCLLSVFTDHFFEPAGIPLLNSALS